MQKSQRCDDGAFLASRGAHGLSQLNVKPFQHTILDLVVAAPICLGSNHDICSRRRMLRIRRSLRVRECRSTVCNCITINVPPARIKLKNKLEDPL